MNEYENKFEECKANSQQSSGRHDVTKRHTPARKLTYSAGYSASPTTHTHIPTHTATCRPVKYAAP